MSPSVFRQVASLLDGRDEFGEGRLDEGGGRGHWDGASGDANGWGCLVMYIVAD